MGADRPAARQRVGSMKLCYGSSSAFSRKVRVAAIECGLDESITLIRTNTMQLDPELAAFNPLAKVPALIADDGEAFYDSPVICEYLDWLDGGHRLLPPAGPGRWRVLRRQALGDGLMESLIFLGVPVRRPEGETTAPARLERERARIERTLDVLESQADEIESEGASIGCIAVGCALGWHDFRFPDWDWRRGRPHLAGWYEAFSRRRSMIETAPVRKLEQA